jgi:hypothetical protein
MHNESVHEAEVKRRVNSWHREAEQGRLAKRARDGKGRSWLNAVESGARTVLSRPLAAARRIADGTGSWITKPPEPGEQCC